MEFTQETADKLMAHMLTIAKRNREAQPYSKSENFLSVANVVLANGEETLVPLRWSSNKEKWAVMEALSLTAREQGALAIALASDVRWCESTAFAKYFHIADPSNGEASLEAFQREYGEIMRGIYGGEMKQLPRELWNEAIVVAIKGPMIEEAMMMAYYREGPKDSIEWYDDKKLDEGRVELYMLPDWWETVTDKR